MASAPLHHRNRRVGLLALLAALAMLGLGFASVPLYRLFCQVTGYGGTTQRASLSDADLAAQFAGSAGAREFSIRFDANTARDLDWQFAPRQTTDRVTIGERDMVIFDARNNTDHPITGTATFNVEPEQAGVHFNKIQCFCFTEQVLQPGESVAMPVLFFVDPAAADDPNMKQVEQITLSYTFHRKE